MFKLLQEQGLVPAEGHGDDVPAEGQAVPPQPIPGGGDGDDAVSDISSCTDD